MLIDSVGVSP